MVRPGTSSVGIDVPPRFQAALSSGRGTAVEGKWKLTAPSVLPESSCIQKSGEHAARSCHPRTRTPALSFCSFILFKNEVCFHYINVYGHFLFMGSDASDLGGNVKFYYKIYAF